MLDSQTELAIKLTTWMLVSDSVGHRTRTGLRENKAGTGVQHFSGCTNPSNQYSKCHVMVRRAEEKQWVKLSWQYFIQLWLELIWKDKGCARWVPWTDAHFLFRHRCLAQAWREGVSVYLRVSGGCEVP